MILRYSYENICISFYNEHVFLLVSKHKLNQFKGIK